MGQTTRPISVTTQFATETGQQPASQLDQNFADLVNSVNNPANQGNFGTDTGTANAYVVNLNPAATALTDGLTITFRVLNTNSGNSTLNVNGLGAKSIVGQSGGAVIGGALTAGSLYTVTWNAVAQNWVVTSFTGVTLTLNPPQPNIFYWT